MCIRRGGEVARRRHNNAITRDIASKHTHLAFSGRSGLQVFMRGFFNASILQPPRSLPWFLGRSTLAPSPCYPSLPRSLARDSSCNRQLVMVTGNGGRQGGVGACARAHAPPRLESSWDAAGTAAGTSAAAAVRQRTHARATAASFPCACALPPAHFFMCV